MSFTRTVPVSVPSVFQSSPPETPSLAWKYNAPLNTVNCEGKESPIPGLMSFTRTVPASVPSVFQSSSPETPSSATKYSAPLNTVNCEGEELPTPGLMSFTRVAPASVPTVFQSSAPETPSLAAKYNTPLKTVNPERGEAFTRSVPALVPSVFQSPLETPSLAANNNLGPTTPAPPPPPSPPPPPPQDEKNIATPIMSRAATGVIFIGVTSLSVGAKIRLRLRSVLVPFNVPRFGTTWVMPRDPDRALVPSRMLQVQRLLIALLLSSLHSQLSALHLVCLQRQSEVRRRRQL